MSDYSNDLIYGANKDERVVSVEAKGDTLILFKEMEDGSVVEELMNATYWAITNRQISQRQDVLQGKQHYKYLARFETPEEMKMLQDKLYQKRIDFYRIYDAKECNMVLQGITSFKGLTPKDVSVLSFDIESDGLTKSPKSTVYIITNTYRNINGTIRKSFFLEDYESQADMLVSWAAWVRQINPSIMLGHNIFSYDFPYLAHVAVLHGVTLKLGRDQSDLRFHHKPSKFRKDGSQEYEYFKANIFGREIVDSFFLSMKYDIGRAFPSYGLKPIIKHLKLEKPDRTFVDAGKIRQYFESREQDPEMWKNVKKYAEEDSDDALKLFDLMIPSFFYMSQTISKSFQEINCGATGSQINNIMVRSYLQEGHSIAKASEPVPFEGAISLGIPGQYRNCIRWDVASLYPSIMRQYKVYSPAKDPKGKFLELVDTLTIDRLKDKKMAKETGDQYFKDLESSKKTTINSCYGALAAQGLQYNFPEGAALITRKGREILGQAIEWATGENVEDWLKRNKGEVTDDGE